MTKDIKWRDFPPELTNRILTLRKIAVENSFREKKEHAELSKIGSALFNIPEDVLQRKAALIESYQLWDEMGNVVDDLLTAYDGEDYPYTKEDAEQIATDYERVVLSKLAQGKSL